MITILILAQKGKMSTEWTIVPGELSLKKNNGNSNENRKKMKKEISKTKLIKTKAFD